MKATLHFNLEDEGDRNNHDLALHGLELALAIRDFRHWLREKRRYGDLHEAAQAFAEEAWDTLHQTLNAQGVAELVD